MVERVEQLGDRAVDLEDLVDGAGVAGALGADQADVVGRDLRVLQPGAEEEIAAAQAKAGGIGGGFADDALHLGGELGRGAFVGVEQEEPRMLEVEREGGVAVGGVVVETRVWTWAPAARAISGPSVESESKTWMSSDHATEASAAGRSCCSFFVRIRTEMPGAFTWAIVSRKPRSQN